MLRKKRNRLTVIILSICLLFILGGVVKIGLVASASAIFSLTAEPNPSENCVELNWTSVDTEGNYSYMLYQKRGDETIAESEFQSIPANDNVKVLQVYPYTPQLVDWVNAYGQGKITCDAVTFETFNADPDRVWDYDVIVFGFWDGNNSKDLTTESLEVVKSYISKGYGVLFGHDTMNSARIANFNSLASYCNVELAPYDTEWQQYSSNGSQVTIAKKGLLTNYPYQIGDVGTVLTIPYSHSVGQQTLGDVWMTFTNQENPVYKAYLSTWNNCALIQTGHSNGAATVDEQKLLMNTLFYLSQRTVETSWSDHMGQDLTGPDKPKLLSTELDEVQNGLQISFSSMDQGDCYQYYVEATDTNTGDKTVSNTVSTTLTTGIKGYSIVVDQKEDTVPDDTIETSEEMYLAPIDDAIDFEKTVHIHIKAIDNAGNASETLHANYFVLNAEANPSNNCVDLKWVAPEVEGNYSYMLYQTKGEDIVTKSDFQSIPANDEVHVLQIYPYTPQLVGWVNAYGQGKITCDAVPIETFNANPSIIWNYDVIAFGFWDCNCDKDLTSYSLSVVKQYIEKGYGVLFGHDTICTLTNRVFNSLASYCNIQLAPITDWKRYTSNGSQVTIAKKGLLTNYPYQIGDIGTVLTIPYAHTVGQQAFGDIWMTFNNQVNPLYKAYLSTWNNCAMIQTGHSNGAATVDEQKLLMNTLFYLSQRTLKTYWSDHMGQDLTGPKLPSLNEIEAEYTNKGIILNLYSEDQGDTYQYYVEATNADTNEKITSNIKTVTLQTGLLGYSVVVDQNPNTIPDNQVETKTDSCFASLGDELDLEQPVYIHIKAIDKAGNESETLHTTYNYVEPVSDFEGELESLLDYAPKVHIKLAVGTTTLSTANFEIDLLKKLVQKNMDTTNFTLEVIPYESKEAFMQLLEPEYWEVDAIRFVINLTDDESFYSDIEFMEQVKEKITKESIFYIGWGNSLVWQDISKFVESMGKKGAYIYSGNYTRSIECIAHFIIWNTTFPEGSGTVDDPYILRHGGQIRSIKYRLYGYFELGQDIDFNGAEFWGIGSYETPFTGHFDGKGYTIRNFHQPGGEIWDYAGFFRAVYNATIINVVLSDITIEGNSYVGGLIGYAYGNETHIQSCEILEATIRGTLHVGGLVGMLDEVDMYDCSSFACVFGQFKVGGCIGHAKGAIIKNIFTAATVTGESEVGGIIGSSNSNRVETCESIANLIGNNQVGGLIGYHNGNKLDACIFEPLVWKCESIATVKGQVSVGGIIGYGDNAKVENCSSGCTIEGESAVGGITGAGQENQEIECTDFAELHIMVED